MQCSSLLMVRFMLSTMLAVCNKVLFPPYACGNGYDDSSLLIVSGSAGGTAGTGLRLRLLAAVTGFHRKSRRRSPHRGPCWCPGSSAHFFWQCIRFSCCHLLLFGSTITQGFDLVKYALFPPGSYLLVTIALTYVKKREQKNERHFDAAHWDLLLYVGCFSVTSEQKTPIDKWRTRLSKRPHARQAR